MDLAELKNAWNVYDRKLETTHAITDSTISSMIRARSLSRVSWIEKMYWISFVCNFLWISLSALVIKTNPFGFTFAWQHAPTLLLNLSLVALLLISINGYRSMKAIDINKSSLDGSLKRIILSLERPWKYLKWNIIAILLSAFLFPVSFLPVTIKALGLWQALVLLFASMSTVALVCLVSAKLGLFKERYRALFYADLKELTELKSISSELSEE